MPQVGETPIPYERVAWRTGFSLTQTAVLVWEGIDGRALPTIDVVVIDDGRIIIDADADELRGSAVDVVGTRSAVESFTSSREVLHRTALGGLATATVAGLDDAGRAAAREAGLELAPVSLQQLVIRTTTGENADRTNGENS